jgi:hypothetical protein
VSAKPFPLLQKEEKNDIIAAIRAVGLDPREFDLDECVTEVRVTNKRSEWSFIVGGRPGHYVGRYTFAEGMDRPYEDFRWDAVMSHVNRWLQLVKRDLDTPDLWAELRREAELLGGGSNNVIANTLFTSEEQKEISQRLNKLSKDVSNAISLSKAQKQILNEKIDYLIDGSRRLGRKDWLNAFIGVTLGYLLSTALPPDVARDIFSTCLRAIGLLYPELPLLD